MTFGHSGVYFLWREDVCVYVGKSIQIHARVREHIGTKQFDAYSWLEFAGAELLAMEKHYIDLMRPPLNVSGTFRAGENRRKLFAERQLRAV
jgi:excinuclease UvrABC nuclease subunit